VDCVSDGPGPDRAPCGRSVGHNQSPLSRAAQESAGGAKALTVRRAAEGISSGCSLLHRPDRRAGTMRLRHNRCNRQNLPGEAGFRVTASESESGLSGNLLAALDPDRLQDGETDRRLGRAGGALPADLRLPRYERPPTGVIRPGATTGMPLPGCAGLAAEIAGAEEVSGGFLPDFASMTSEHEARMGAYCGLVVLQPLCLVAVPSGEKPVCRPQPEGLENRRRNRRTAREPVSFAAPSAVRVGKPVRLDCCTCTVRWFSSVRRSHHQHPRSVSAGGRSV
jgi:hypothetical protein